MSKEEIYCEAYSSISRILVAFDGSDHWRKATELAVLFFLISDGMPSSTLLHVLETNVPEAFEEYARIEFVSPLI